MNTWAINSSKDTVSLEGDIVINQLSQRYQNTTAENPIIVLEIDETKAKGNNTGIYAIQQNYLVLADNGIQGLTTTSEESEEFDAPAEDAPDIISAFNG